MRNFLLITLALVVVLIFPLAVLLSRVNSVILEPEPLIKIFQEQNITAKFINFAIEEYLNKQTYPNEISAIVPVEELTKSVQEIITAPWLESQLVYLLREIYQLTESGKRIQDLNLTLQLTQPRSNLQKEFTSIKDIVLNDFSSLPSCDYQQLRDMRAKLQNIGSEEEMNILQLIPLTKEHNCWPTLMFGSPEQLYNEISGELPVEDIITALPQQISILKIYLFSQDHSLGQNIQNNNLVNFFSFLDSPLNENEIKKFQAFNEYLLQGQIYIAWLRLTIFGLILLIALFFFIFFLLTRKKISKLISFFSILSIIFGIQLLFLNTLTRINWLSVPVISSNLQQLPAPVLTIITDFLFRYVNFLFAPLLLPAIILLGLGFGGIIFRFFYAFKK